MSGGLGRRVSSDRDSLSAKLECLSRPESYPEHCIDVERIETHFSSVFPTECHACKLKKPVHDELADLPTLEARRRNCVEEVTPCVETHESC